MSAYAFIVYRRSGVDAQLASHVLMDNGLPRVYMCGGRQPGITRLLAVLGNEYTSRAHTCRHTCTPSDNIQGRVHPRNSTPSPGRTGTVLPRNDGTREKGHVTVRTILQISYKA